ncbi:CDP-diacylglycerol--glycerol-3-phosphate 3-phosphatidyltransferase [Metamycoplasma arthritidis]|uniref:CDP-diacylglycerol--glycerol-3-phosphate 3-phosphatidyltransferase n=1 Tax=Metamycoplasma arthritidis (strain 158L3-1) TaxID=243272 RepID=B3PMG5_META1|nr:CDP-diacylglycerol--glycerol-3-phosphate 3-phosphatidyltransferase [Metamycoplasma arthritidis]ACF07217.1 CDP-diacylglycerol-glycerol-3-phosphate [Metamycoplasma arthritidis 158L3-1]VEU78741.1 CDP-diacylglycerol--glycerol-3-phosphate 3-phosphatidyltransferase [Metamycoplasma arthritidis]
MKKQKKNKMPKDKKIRINKNKFGAANWLTVTRLLLMIPFLIIMTAMFALQTNGSKTEFWYEGILLKGSGHPIWQSVLYWLNVTIFIVAMITDFVDGHIARKTKTISAFGKVFDPIADKVATNMMLIFLAMLNFTYWPIVILFIVRDIMVDGTRMYASKKNIKIQANIWGKIKTILVSFAILAIAFSGPWLTHLKDKENNDKSYVLIYVNLTLIAGLIISWVSGIIYMTKYLKGIREDLVKELEKQFDNKANENSDNKTTENTSDDHHTAEDSVPLVEDQEEAKAQVDSTQNA